MWHRWLHDLHADTLVQEFCVKRWQHHGGGKLRSHAEGRQKEKKIVTHRSGRLETSE
jgi:hypothetical protein